MRFSTGSPKSTNVREKRTGKGKTREETNKKGEKGEAYSILNAQN